MESHSDILIKYQPEFDPEKKYKITSKRGRVLYGEVTIITLGEKREDAGYYLIDGERYKIKSIENYKYPNYFVLKVDSKGYSYITKSGIKYRERQKQEIMGDYYDKYLWWKIELI